MLADTAEKEAVVAGLLNRPVHSMMKIAGGRNSQVYRVTRAGLPESDDCVAKFYTLNPNTGHSRLSAEFDGLNFLWSNGERAIPRPLAADQPLNCAVYEYVEGVAIHSSTVRESDIEQGVAFLSRLKGMADAPGCELIPSAAEACFSTSAIIENLRMRQDRLLNVQTSSVHLEALQSFLQAEFEPEFQRLVDCCHSYSDDNALRLNRELERGERTLSPSDFGFHNAVKKPDGRIVFLDFEYFGWDDPAKMISDFLLHPAMDLPPGLKQVFLTKMLTGFHEQPHFAARVKSVYPLFGLKWCLILLNEFVPEHITRRNFAQDDQLNNADAQARQLSKAERLLKEVISAHDGFPYQLQ